jgi:hypothetical protein
VGAANGVVARCAREDQRVGVGKVWLEVTVIRGVHHYTSWGKMLDRWRKGIGEVFFW